MNYEILRGKYLLLDTNVVIDYSKYPPFFAGFIAKLKEYDVTLVMEQTVRFEFLRKANSPEQRKGLNEFLESLLKTEVELPIDKTTVEKAIEIANIYDWKNETKIDLADCFLASAMKHFNGSSKEPRVYLATQNHKDFPDFVFKRVGIETIDIARTSILNIGFYEFDNDSFVKVEAAYKSQK